MRHLSEVTVYFDDKRLVKLNKASGLPQELGLPKGLKNRSPEGTMTVSNVQSTRECRTISRIQNSLLFVIVALYIQTEVMKWIYTSGTERKRLAPTKVTKPSVTSGGFFSSLFSSLATGNSTPRATTPALPIEVVNPLAVNQTSVSLSIYSATVDVKLDKKTVTEIHRSTKKNPPSKMKFELIYVSFTSSWAMEYYLLKIFPRLQRMNTTPVSRRMPKLWKQLEVYSRVYAPI